METQYLMSFKAIFRFQPYLQFWDTCKLAFVGMKEVVTGGEFYLVVQGVGCRKRLKTPPVDA